MHVATFGVRNIGLVSHLISHHPSRFAYKCAICLKVCGSPDTLPSGDFRLVHNSVKYSFSGHQKRATLTLRPFELLLMLWYFWYEKCMGKPFLWAQCYGCQHCVCFAKLTRAYCVRCFVWTRVCRQPAIVLYTWCNRCFIPHLKLAECTAKCCGGAICSRVARFILRRPDVVEEERGRNKELLRPVRLWHRRVVRGLRAASFWKALQISLCTSWRCLALLFIPCCSR